MALQSAAEKWVSIIEAGVENTVEAQRLISGLRGVKPLLHQTFEHWRKEKPTTQSKAKARDELDDLHRSMTAISAQLARLGDTAHQAVKYMARQELLKIYGSSVLGSDYESPTSRLMDDLSTLTKIIGDATQSMKSEAKISYRRDLIRDFAIRTVAVAFQKEAPDIELSSKPSSVFHQVTEEFLGDLGMYDSNLRRSIGRLFSEGRLIS